MGAEPQITYPQVERRMQPDMQVVNEKLDVLVEGHARMNTALFATDDKNEFGCPGVMVVMQKIDRHVDVWCSAAAMAKRLMKFGFWFVTGLAGTVATLKAAGWW